MFYYEDWPTPDWEQQGRLYVIKHAMSQLDLKGKVVLDVAAGYGYYSYMALQMGAKHVTMFDRGAGFLKLASENMEKKGIANESYTTTHGDIFNLNFPAADVVLCTGILYHTFRQQELLEKVKATGAETVLMETMVLDTHRVCLMYRDDRKLHVPSPRLVEIMLAESGFQITDQRPTLLNRLLYILK